MINGSAEQPIVALENVGMYYASIRRIINARRIWALKDVSLKLFAGETLGIIGRNGVGKSTLLLMLAGIIEPDLGTIKKGPGLKASLLSLQAGFVGDLTGRKNIILSGMFLGLPRRSIKAKIPEIIEMSELGEVIDRPVSTYSAGMKARLGFSIAVQIDPDILLIDEVLSVGDRPFQQKSKAILHEIISSHKSVVIVSHSPEILESLCDRLVWIEDGVSKAEGEPDDVLRMYYDFLEQRKDKDKNAAQQAGQT